MVERLLIFAAMIVAIGAYVALLVWMPAWLTFSILGGMFLAYLWKLAGWMRDDRARCRKGRG